MRLYWSEDQFSMRTSAPDMAAINFVTPNNRTRFDEKKSMFHRGSRMILVAPMQYLEALGKIVTKVLAEIDQIELNEQGLENADYFNSVYYALAEEFDTARQMGALKEDFRYLLAYAPPIQVECAYLHEAQAKCNQAVQPFNVMKANHRFVYCWTGWNPKISNPHATVNRGPERFVADLINWDEMVSGPGAKEA